VRLTPGLVCLSEPQCGLCLARRWEHYPGGYLPHFEDTYGALRELFGTETRMSNDRILRLGTTGLLGVDTGR
jgi:hypothetical protein